MRINIQKYLLLLIFSLVALGAWATVSEYTFTSSLGTYTEISGGTVLGTTANDNESFNAIPLGFTFNFNGVAYTEISVQTNGFIAMGSTVASSNVAISAATGTNNIAAALNRDLKSRDTGELMYLSSGTEPNRVFTVQWKHYRRVPTTTANDDLNFQIQLRESGNRVVFVYGSMSAVTASTAAAIQVGLRGDANTDFNNRTTTTDWSATTAGTANNNTCTLSASVFPATGLTFEFTGVIVGEVPLPAQNPNPANAAVNVPRNITMSWAAGGGITDGYKVYFGTDNPPSNIVNGTTQTGTTYQPATMPYSTTYFWKIVPFNQFGDAINCPTWSFTTLADPTVTTFPFVENFDTLIPPALPLGWTTINANADAYTWETYNGNADTAPNSVRIRYNTTLAMNDWLLMPPMQFVQNHHYKVKFSYRAASATYPEKLALYWGSAPTVEGMPNQIFVNENVNLATYTPVEIILTPTASGVYYFGFKGYSDIDMFYLYLDTISIEELTELLIPPTNLTATVTGFNVHLAWTAPAPQRALLGYKVYRGTELISTISNPATLAYDDNGLLPGNYSYTVTAFYTTGESVPTAPATATVEAPPAPPTNLTAVVNGNDVTLDWDNPEPPLTGDWITWCQDVVGNSIGTNEAVTFDVAHRWTQTDLAPYAGRTISQIKFVPAFANCVYTVKVWTGGSATSAGTLVTSQVVPTFVEDDWNLVILNNPVPIPTTGDLYYGFEVNTQGGYPAGCDDGPQIEGKGNMMYFEGEWTTLTALAPTLTYNWSVKAFAQSGVASKAVEMVPIAEHQIASPNGGTLASNRFTPSRNDRAISGYKVYRDGTLISTITDPNNTTYTDLDLANATYTYGVSATYTTGESAPATVQAVVNVVLPPVLFGETFESYDNFAMTFSPWTLLDIDQSATYGITGVEFPGSASPMAYIVFNPSATTPPLTTLTPHGGAKMAASFASTTPPNNDFMVTPRMTLGTGSALKFYAKSHTNTYGLERFRVGVSTLPTIVQQGFQYITGANYVEAPVNWTEYVYDLSAYDGQTVYIAIRCVSNDAFIFYVDDFTVHSNGGSVANEDPTIPAIQTELVGNFPNPFNPETTIRYNVKESTPVTIGIYNLKGQLVKTLVNDVKDAGNHSVVWNGTDNNGRSIASGVYYYKMQAGKFSSTKKMILMK